MVRNRRNQDETIITLVFSEKWCPMQRRGNICLDAKERVSNCNACWAWGWSEDWSDHPGISRKVGGDEGVAGDFEDEGGQVERVEEDEGERGRILFGASECPCLGLRPPEGGRWSVIRRQRGGLLEWSSSSSHMIRRDRWWCTSWRGDHSRADHQGRLISGWWWKGGDEVIRAIQGKAPPSSGSHRHRYSPDHLPPKTTKDIQSKPASHSLRWVCDTSRLDALNIYRSTIKSNQKWIRNGKRSLRFFRPSFLRLSSDAKSLQR